MDREDSSNDERSIAPVSSLRHRFEQLGTLPTSRERSAIREQQSINNTRHNAPLPTKAPIRDDRIEPAPPNPPANNLSNESANTQTNASAGSTKNGVAAEDKTQTDIVVSSKPTNKPVVPRKKPGLASHTSETAQAIVVAAQSAAVQPAAVQPAAVQPAAVRPAAAQSAALQAAAAATATAQNNGDIHGQRRESATDAVKAPLRGRFSSDASWVEHLHERQNSQPELESFQTASDTSKHRARSSMQDALRTRPARVSSDASWVESLSSTPPRTVVERPREYKQDLSTRGTYLRRETSSRTSTPPPRHSPSPHASPRLPDRRRESPNFAGGQQDVRAFSAARRISPRPAEHQPVDPASVTGQDVDSRPSTSRRISPLPWTNPHDACRSAVTSNYTVTDSNSASTFAAASTSQRSTTFVPPRSLQRSATDLEAHKPLLRTATFAIDGADESTSKKGLLPPAVPAPRRSIDRRRDFANDPPVRASVDRREAVKVEQLTDTDQPESNDEARTSSILANFPDASRANRRPPRYPKAPWHIPTEYDTRIVVADHGLVCTSGFITRVWDIQKGLRIMEMPHQEVKKVTALAMTSDRGSPQLWLGTCVGDLLQVDINSGNVVHASHQAHRGREIVRIFARRDSLWTVDDAGEVSVWPLSAPSKPLATHRVQRGHTFSLVAEDKLWVASGKDVQVYKPGSPSDRDFVITKQPLTQPNLGDISAGCTLSNRVYLGHTDGKVSVYDRQKLLCVGVVHVSLSKICVLAGIGDCLWAGFGSGSITVYDTAPSPWTVRKDWSAHDKQVCGIVVESSSIRDTGILRVLSLALDNNIKIWDGLYKADWLEDRLNTQLARFSSFNDLSISVFTWNAGASKPSHLQHMISDEDQLVEYLRQSSTSDILVFGFQELVDLEDKKLTAKSIFRSKKKDAYEQDHMTHQYRAWRDYLSRLLVQRKGDQYILLHTASMIGLFTCIFVRSPLRARIKHVHQAEIKRGMGGRYGNKGALVLRMLVDDSSLCFLNCHLAAGQTQTSSRNNDIAAILESTCFPAPMLDHHAPSDIFAGGGDGSMILDHDICILNGDLNYRIDTMSRETVIKHVQQGNIARLLERDQLRLSRKKNPVFKLRVFDEEEIRFAPTYKYNPGTDIYDTSEKRRSPAWCDRVLYRGAGMSCDNYRRWEVKISDHRPVSSRLSCRIKKVDVSKRADVMKECLLAFDRYRQELHSASY